MTYDTTQTAASSHQTVYKPAHFYWYISLSLGAKRVAP